ncbi:CehA/McbA family metallohydrolase [Superficieibacter sp.]|uniref:CehA/McbA family metallohydrolase n=1 Tax=Superficieibacter sp. TaxID=2303322 RepID=UPI0028B11BBD|nr:CehA/McbA family metallohydrolase [Superficieibacter sp.]
MERANNTFHQQCRVFPADEKQLRSIEFPLDDDVERLEIAYQFSEGCVVDLGLQINDDVVGWSGGARREIVISENVATPGYRRMRPRQGRGYVLLGLYKITSACLIDIHITFRRKTPRWLRGDTHVHSEHSDGRLSVEALIERALASDYDFLCFTDHNTTSQNRVISGINSSLCLIPGMELTTGLGHVNFLGLGEPVQRFLPHFSEQDVMAKINEARHNGARIGINHPFCHHCPWLLPFSGHHWLEIWNGPWEGVDNEAAFQFWLQRLSEGARIPVTAGSDFHKEKHQSLPCAVVWANSAEQEDILFALEHGKSYMQCDTRTRLHQFAIGAAGPGDITTETLLQIELETEPDNTVLLYTDQKIHLLNNWRGHVSQTVDCRESAFAFLRVNHARSARLITNPIFRE